MTFSCRYIVIIILILGFYNCGLRTYKLKDNHTEVPASSIFFEKRNKFVKTKLKEITTEFFHEAVGVTKARIENRYGKYSKTELCRFYSNGCLSFFIIDHFNFKPNDFNPLYTGKRAIYYKENGKVLYDTYGTISSSGKIGKISGMIKIKGDTIEMHNSENDFVNIYVKTKKYNKYLHFKGEW